MENVEILKIIVDDLMSRTDTAIWGDFRSDWKSRNSPEFKLRLSSFKYELQRLASCCNIKAYNGCLYIFDGEIWRMICSENKNFDIIYVAFLNFLKAMGIREPFTNNFIKQYFISNIFILNRLHPTFNEVAFLNGVLDVYTGEFTPFSPSHHVIYRNNYKYDAKADCRLFKSFLHQVLPDKNSRRIIQMFLGLGLIERGTVYDEYDNKNRANVELCLVLVGHGRNGKSTLCNVVKGVFGTDRISDCEYDDVIRYGDEGMRSRAKLNGMVFNICQDVSQKSFSKSTGIFKKLISCERVDMRVLGENVDSIKKIPYFMFCMNALPNSTDTSLGFIRRLQYVAFDVIIPKDKVNPDLGFELQKEYSGIFNWILRGARELRRKKFRFPDSEGSKRLEIKTKLNMNPIEAWLTAYGVRPEGAVLGEQGVWVKSIVMSDSITKFIEDNGGDVAFSIQKLGSTMRNCGFHKKRLGEGIQYLVFGCNENDMLKQFIIDDEQYKLGKESEDMYINEED